MCNKRCSGPQREDKWAFQERSNKRRNLVAWRMSRLRRLEFSRATHRQEARIAQLGRLLVYGN